MDDPAVIWLTASQDKASPSHKDRRDPPQRISLFANTLKLQEDMAPYPFIMDGDNVLTSILWYGKIGSRGFSLECVVNSPAWQRMATIYTYFSDVPGIEDWRMVLEFYRLPTSVYSTRPYFIDSRSRSLDYVVFRPDPRGWDTPIYRAASAQEAENFLSFLNTDNWNDGCFIGQEEGGAWGVFVMNGSVERQIAGYPSLSETLGWACGISRTDLEITVRKAHDTNSKKRYRITDGRAFLQ